MAAHEGRGPRAAEPLGRADDVALRRAHVGDDRPLARRQAHPFEQRLDRQDRRGEHDEVGVSHARVEIGRHGVERPVLQRRPEPFGLAADPDDPAGEPAGPRRLRHGAAQQADTDDREVSDHAEVFPSTTRSAFTSLRFSSGVPTVIRSAVSRPKGVIGRTITPWWRSF